QKIIIGLFTIFLIAYGGYELTKLPIDAVPDITDNQVQVITVAPSLGAPDVERLITFPIEQANSNIPGLKEIRSFSRFGLSLITIVFEDDVDIYWARQQVTERLKIAGDQIPKGIGSPELAPVTTGLGEIYQYVLKPKAGYEKHFDATELRTIQDWIVRRQLINVKGVADVSSFGGKVKQFEIAIDPNVLQANNITISDVFQALEKNNENAGGGYIEKESTVLYIRAEGLIENIADIQNVLVRKLENGSPLLIKDVAQVRIGHASRYGAMTYNVSGEVAGGVVMMLKGENSSKVIGEVKAKIDQIKKTLPEGIELESFLDRTKMVDSAIGTVTKNLLEGALIVILILVLFLGNFRAGIIVATVIPLSMLFAVIMMNIFHVSGNLMSLGALDFGLIVDGTVIIVEACMFQLHTSKLRKVSQLEMDDIVYRTSTRMRNAAVFGELIILAVYLPIFTLQGIEGKMFIPMAQTVAFALFGAFILSLTYVPMMSALFLNKNISHKQNISDKMMSFLENRQQNILKKALAIPKGVIGIVLGLFVVALFVFSNLGGEFIPELPEGDFAVETRVLTGSNITTSTEAITKSARILLAQFPEVEKVVGKTGSGEIPTDPMPMEASDMMIILKDKSQWKSASSWNELSEKMSTVLQDIPGVTFSFQYPVAMRFNELMTGAKQDVVCKIFGENLDSLSKYSKKLGKIAAKINGAKNIYIEPIDGLPQLIIKYNRSLISQYGLNIQDVNKVVNTAFAGQSCGLVFEDEKRFDLVVRLDGNKKKELDDVKNLLIPVSSTTQIPLSQIAAIDIKESVNQIQRDDAKRRIIVGFNVGDRDVQSMVEDLQKEVEAQLKLPMGYYITYGGAFENLEAAKDRLLIAVPVSLILIFVLLYFAFKSVKNGLLIYSAIPLSAIGGVFLLALRGMPFSISAGIGFIALFGVAVLNGIVLIAEYNRIKKEGMNDIIQIVLTGTKHRLRPVLMTAFVASLGFLPMALSNGAGAEVQRPLATVVIGGLLIATLLTLFVLPILYVIVNGGYKLKMNKVKTLLLIIGISVFVKQSIAQTPISFQAAIDTALANNLVLKNEKLRVAYQQQLIKTSSAIPQTILTGDFGRLNSIYLDNRINISQTIEFPTVYSNKKKVLSEECKKSELNVKLKTSELKKEVALVFYHLIHLDEKKNLLLRIDSIYSSYLEKVRLKLDLGESNILEKSTIDNQRLQIAHQLIQLNSEIEIELLHFQILLNTNTLFIPNVNNTQLILSGQIDQQLIYKHPSLQTLDADIQIALATVKYEKAKLNPSLMLAVSSGTMYGSGADNKDYTYSTRFNNAQIGIGLPLFSGQRQNVKAAQIYTEIVVNNLEIAKQNLENQFAIVIKKYEIQKQIVKDLEELALPNGNLIFEIAQKQLLSGEINYLDWALLVNQSIVIQSNYKDAILKLNEIAIELTYLLNAD
ncbi:MAG: CusA/CzcA family heavy metal efflux RND transporter, partial [Flavobacteriia bacterium]|nr:CusA/CzcA family heavy metal efflux RND transporter [Flavobacteriia bacterium]